MDRCIRQIEDESDNFNAEEFLAGAQAAFEMIISSFAKGDISDLVPFLDNDVYNNFDKVIQERLSAKETLENNLVRIVDCQIIEAKLIDKNASLTVKIVSEQINVTRSDDGTVVKGDADYVSTITDIWTFSRSIGSQDPNWVLIATRSLD